MDVKLIMFREDGRRGVFALAPGVTLIGRKTDCHIRIPLAEVSRLHAEIHIDEDGPMVKDLGTANGTFLNNRRITEEDLEAGDQLMVGPVVFTVQIDGDPADEDIVEIRSKVPSAGHPAAGAATVGTSKHVAMSEDNVDPIAALEALASSADQTAINPEDDE